MAKRKPKQPRKRVIGGKEYTLIDGRWIRFVSGEEARIEMQALEAKWAAYYIAHLGELPADLACWLKTPPDAGY